MKKRIIALFLCFIMVMVTNSIAFAENIRNSAGTEKSSNTEETTNLKDGIVYPGIDIWWKTEKDENLKNYYFTLNSIDVIYKNEVYSIPKKTFKYLNETDYHDYNANDSYTVCVQVSDTGAAEYILYSGNDVSNDIVYYDTYSIIPIIDIWTNTFGEIFFSSVLSKEVYAGEKGYAGDGIVRPNDEGCWWSTSISWIKYNPWDEDENIKLFPLCEFSLDNIDVVCKGERYNISSKYFKYDVVFNYYDYERNDYYLVCVQINDDGTAEYKLRSFGNTEALIECGRPVYYDTYTIIPIIWAYADDNGQLIPNSDYAMDSIFINN